MKFLNFGGKNKSTEKMVTDLDKFVDAEIGMRSSTFVAPKFNRKLAVRAYEGMWSSALDYNVNAASSGILRLYAKTSNNGQKCLFNTQKHKNLYQRDFIDSKLLDKPSNNAQYKIMDSREDFETVQGHPINDLLRKPNPFQSNYEFFVKIFLNLELTGDAFIHVVSYPDGRPAAMAVLQSQHVDIHPAKKGTGKLVERYEYKKNVNQPVSFPEDEIIHIKYENPDSILYGMGKIEKGWNSYLLNKYSHQFVELMILQVH